MLVPCEGTSILALFASMSKHLEAKVFCIEEICASINHLVNCLTDVKVCLKTNFLSLNEKKTEILVFGTPELTNKVRSFLVIFEFFCVSQARNLGVL